MHDQKCYQATTLRHGMRFLDSLYWNWPRSPLQYPTLAIRLSSLSRRGDRTVPSHLHKSCRHHLYGYLRVIEARLQWSNKPDDYLCNTDRNLKRQGHRQTLWRPSVMSRTCLSHYDLYYLSERYRSRNNLYRRKD